MSRTPFDLEVDNVEEIELEVMENQVTLDITVDEATYIYGKSIARIDSLGSPSSESSAVNSYDIVRDDDVVIGTLHIANGEKGDKGDNYIITESDKQEIAGIVESSISGTIESLQTTVSQKANASDLTAHVNDTTVHVTSSDKSNWNSKADYSSVYKKSETYTKSEVNGLVQSARPDDYDSVKGQVGANATSITSLTTRVQTLEDEPSVPEGVVTVTDTEPSEIEERLVHEGELADKLELKANASEVYTKTETDTLLNEKAGKTYVDGQLATKANSSDLSTLGGRVSTVEGRVQNHYWYRISGIIGNALNTASSIFGVITVHLQDGIATIEVSAWYDRQTEGGNFQWGINADIISQLDSRIPSITPIDGGTLKYTTGSFETDSSLEGYGGCWEARNQFWTPARIYNTGGTIGSWPENNVPNGTRFMGVMYGTY